MNRARQGYCRVPAIRRFSSGTVEQKAIVNLRDGFVWLNREEWLVSDTKLWLAQFLFDRSLREPSRKPLHAYRISEAEFSELTGALAGKRQGFDNPVHKVHWCACFCMHVAERYRRRYDAAAGWTWQLFEAPLGLAFTQQDRSEIVAAGLKYWHRPIRRHERANDYLGSLFAEGGLPWSLVSSPTHGFGRAVKSGVRHYYLDKESGHSLPARMAGFYEYFPRSFRTEEVSLLLAGIVTQLISIVETIQIRGSESPIDRLDREMPGWRGGFPIPLDEGNAIQLVSEWLVDADRERKAWQGRTQLDLPSTCAHKLADGELSIDRVLSVISIQREVRFPVRIVGLSSTRLEMVCYEGDRPVRGVGSVYAEIEEGCVRLRSPRPSIELQRKRTQEMLSLRLLDSGAIVHSIALSDSAIDAEHAPAIFERVDDAWWYLSSASCSTRSNLLLIRLPAHWVVANGESTVVSAGEDAYWIETGTDVTLSGERELVTALFAGTESTRCRLAGSMPLVVTRPEQTFLGWPRLEPAVDGAAAPTNQLHMINNQQRARLDGGAEYGSVLYQLCNAGGATLYRQRFGLLPADFRVRLLPRVGKAAAKLTINASVRLVVSAAVGSTQVGSWEHSDESVLELPPGLAGHDDIRISIRSRSNPNAVELQYPFPFEGVRVTNIAGYAVSGRSMTLDELLGMEAVLFAGPTGNRTFRIVLSLMGELGAVPTQYSTVRVADEPVRVRLHSFADEIAMLLGVSDSQDSVVRLSIESGIEHVAFRIGRYKYRAIRADGGKEVIISEADGITQEADAMPAAMCIPEPDIALVPLHAITSPTSGATLFEVPGRLQIDGPWLVHALPESRISFRPLFLLGNPSAPEMQEDNALGAAIRGFHPKLCPMIIAEEVAKMGADPAHPGWDYLKQLRDRFSHLTLSVFEVWRAVASDSRCLALAVLRMELSTEFCHRMQIELAVVWESVPIRHWQDALAACSGWFGALGFPDSLVAQFRESGVRKMKILWSGFDHFGSYLEGGPLPASPPLQLVLPGWYQTLRTQHAEDERWPTQCGTELRSWVAAKDLPQEIKGLATLGYTSAVTYLPIFLAFVTTGRAKLELPGVATPYLKHAVRHVASFDRALWFAPVHGLMTCYLARAIQ